MTSNAPLLALALKSAAALPLKTGVMSEIYLTQTRGRSITWSDGKLDMEHQSTHCGLTVRLLSQSKQAMASAQDFSPESARSTWNLASSALEFSQADPALTLPGKPTAAPQRFELDPDIFQTPGDRVKENLKGLEAKIKERDPRLSKVIRIGFSEAFHEWALVNSHGAAVSEGSTESSFGLEVLAQANGRSEVAGRFLARRFGRDLAPEPLIKQVCEEALQSLGARPIPSGNYPTIFDPWVGSQFLELVAQALCADQIQKGKSFFERPEKESVASRLVTLIDDGTLQKGLASSAYDDEGTPRSKTILIDKGTLKHLMYDATFAKRDGTVSTGNGDRPSFSRPPAPGPSNFYLAPGSTPLEEIIRNTGRGFLVQEVMGMHTANPVSGDFSVGAQGRWIDAGQLSHAVRGVTLAGNLKKLLLGIDAVGNDLTWYGSVGTPTFRVSQLTVGGT